MKISILPISLYVFLASASLRAEVVTDGTLGSAGPLAGPDYQIGAELGQQRGANLFHSFSDFNLLRTESATFSGPNDVEHIIGRVTGNNPSLIEGTLRSTIPHSQLWLFNPVGIQQLGSVEVPGGVAADTALGLRLKDGGLFNAEDPQTSVLTSAPPQVFFFTEAKQDFGVNEASLYGSTPLIKPDYGSAHKRIKPEINACRLKQYDELSHFVITRYRGSPAGPDDWGSSPLPPLGMFSKASGDKS